VRRRRQSAEGAFHGGIPVSPLTPEQISCIRHALENLCDLLLRAESADPVVRALADDLTANDDCFEPERFTIKRHRMSVTQAECTLSYIRRAGAPWLCRFGDDIILYIEQPAHRDAMRRTVVGIPEPGAEAIAGHAGMGDAGWAQAAERIFYDGHLDRNVKAPRGIGLRSRSDESLLAHVASAIAASVSHADVPRVLQAMSDLAALVPRPAPIRASAGPTC